MNPRHVLFAAILAVSSPSLATAADPAILKSKVDEVTVYVDRAQVTRVADVVTGAGSRQVAFQGLPGWIDQGSVRLGLQPADAGEIIDVEVKQVYLARATSAELRAAHFEAQEIEDKMADLQDEKNILESRAKHVESIRIFSLEKLPKDTSMREVSVQEYADVVEFMTQSLRDIAVERRALDSRRRSLEPELTARRKTLQELNNRSQLQQTTVVATLSGNKKEQDAKLALTYLTPGATWEPAHDLRTATGGDAVRLNTFAVVRNSTGEDWNKAALTLSTQSPNDTTRIPELDALLVGKGGRIPQLLQTNNDSFARANSLYEGQNILYFNTKGGQVFEQAASNYDDNMRQQAFNKTVFTKLQKRGTTAQFSAAGRSTIRTDGKPVRIAIGALDLEAEHSIIAAPELSLNAARTVGLLNSGRQPLLPGQVQIYMDGAFLGATETDFVAPGEPFSLYLGVADQIKLSRRLDRRNSDFSQWGDGSRLQASYLVSVENLSDKPITLELADRIPVSENTEVRVRSVRIEPNGIAPDEEGLIRAPVKLAGKGKHTMRIEYAIEYPTNYGQRADAPVKLRKQIEDLEVQLK